MLRSRLVRRWLHVQQRRTYSEHLGSDAQVLVQVQLPCSAQQPTSWAVPGGSSSRQHSTLKMPEHPQQHWFLPSHPAGLFPIAAVQVPSPSTASLPAPSQQRSYSTQKDDDSKSQDQQSQEPAQDGGQQQHGNDGMPDVPPLHPLHVHMRERGRLFHRIFDEGGAARTEQRMAKSDWLQLLPHPASLLTGQALLLLKIAAFDLMRALTLWRNRNKLQDVQQSLQEAIEESFDMEDFRRGCGMAVTAVLQNYGAADWDALKDMVSEEMMGVMQVQHEALEATGKFEVLQLQPEIQQVEPRAFGFWGAEHIHLFDSRWASQASLTGASTSSWLVAVVYVKALVKYHLQHQKGGKNREVKLGVRRAGFWVFARGPVPSTPVKDLGCPWQVVGTW